MLLALVLAAPPAAAAPDRPTPVADLRDARKSLEGLAGVVRIEGDHVVILDGVVDVAADYVNVLNGLVVVQGENVDVLNGLVVVDGDVVTVAGIRLR